MWLHDVGVAVPADVELTDTTRAEVQRCFVAEFNGSVEVDGLNRLVILAGLTARQIEVLRAYSRYLRQIGFPFSQQYIESTLARHAAISRLLSALFALRFNPVAAAGEPTGEDDLRAQIAEALDAVPSLDDDRTLRALLSLIDATVRTNAFRAGGRRRLPAGAVVQVRHDQGPRSAAAPPDVRDLGVLAAGRGSPSTQWSNRSRWHPLERPPRRLPHRDPRVGQGTDRQERGHRPDRREGRLRV